MNDQNAENPYDAPLAEFADPTADYPPQNEGDATGGLIPYKNPHALVAYYLSIVSMLPLIGIPFGIASIILGFMGLNRRKQNPVIKGSVHAWIGIVLGGLSLTCWSGVIVMMIVGAAGGGF